MAESGNKDEVAPAATVVSPNDTTPPGLQSLWTDTNVEPDPAPGVEPEKEGSAPANTAYRYLVIAVVTIVRVAGMVAYRTYWIVVRVLLPREISRALLHLKRSDYIGWEEDEPPLVGVPETQQALRMRPSTLSRRGGGRP